MKTDAQRTRDLDRTYDLTNPADMVRYVARNRFAWPGGDELMLITDGAVICQGCLRERYSLELQDAIDCTYRETAIMTGADIDPNECFCDNCSKDLSSYAEMEG